MTLSYRARAFSVDNLLKSPANSEVVDVTGETAAAALPVVTKVVLTSQKQFGKLIVNSEKYGSHRDAKKGEHCVTEDDFCIDLRDVHSMSNKDMKHDFSIYRNQISQDMFREENKSTFENGIVPYFHEFKNPAITQRYTAQETDLYRLPFILSSKLAKEERYSETEPPSKKRREGPSSGSTTTCFCHGEISFCHHPGIMSVNDIRGSNNSIMAELCHAELWASFHRLGTEMIITKSGRRMFPALKLRITGLNPDKLYVVRLEFLQPDTRKYRYIYHSSRWMVSGSGDTLTTAQSHKIPEGPVSGQAICSQIVSFERLKLTNTEPSKTGQVSLVSMQKFQPQVVIQEVSTVDGNDVSSSEQYVILFPQTSFMAVTAYQNQQITTLKIASNPFAKGFRESVKTRLPFESYTSAIPNLLSYKSALDYLPGFVKPSLWSPAQHFQWDVNFSLDKRGIHGYSTDEDFYKSAHVKVMKMGIESPGVMSRTRSPTNMAQYTELQKQLNIPLPQYQSHPHYHECQLYQQQQKQHQQHLLISTTPHSLHPLLQPLPYSSELSQPVPKLVAERSPYENYPHLASSQSIMIVSQPPPAHKPFHAVPAHHLNQLSNVSVMSSKLSKSGHLRDNKFTITEEKSSLSLSSRSGSKDVQAVNDSHCSSLVHSSHLPAEQKYTKTNGRNRSSYSSSANEHTPVTPSCLTEAAKSDLNVTCGCTGCDC